jgi:hypothetical protein
MNILKPRTRDIAISLEPAKRLSPQEFEKQLEQSGDALFYNAEAISSWSDYRFKTSEGREFGLFLENVAPLLGRLRAAGVALTKKESENPPAIAGMILERDGAAPIIFADADAMISAWLDLHASFDIAVEEVEGEFLWNCYPDALERWSAAHEGKEPA